MRIKKISTSPDFSGRYRLELEDGTVLRPFRQNVEDYSLYSEKDLTEQEIMALQKSICELSVKMRAIRIVSASSVSKKELERRLIQKGETSDQAKNAVQWLSDMDLLDDQKTAEQIIYSCIQKGYGIARAKQALYEKRIPREYWDIVLEDYPDQEDKINDFIRSRLTDASDVKQVKRIVDALLRRGHSYGTIRRVLDQFSVETDEFPEE